MKRIAVILLLIATGSISGVYYYWRQATNLPNWYTSQEKTKNFTIINETSAQKESEKVKAKITAINQHAAKSNNLELQLNENELNNLFVSEIAKTNKSSKLAEAVKVVKTNIKDGKIESGAVVNISEIPTADLRKEETAALTRVVKAFPSLNNREIYIGIEGKPTIENGKLKFDENTKLKVGNLSFTQAELSKKLGIPEIQIRQVSNIELKLGKIKVNNIELTDDKALLKGSVN